MTDYSKPIGYWCDACGRAHRVDVPSLGESPGGAIHSLSDDGGSGGGLESERDYRARRINEVARATARGRRDTVA